MERNQITSALANSEVVFFMVCGLFFSYLANVLSPCLIRLILELICKTKYPGICVDCLPGVWSMDLTLCLVLFLEYMINGCVSHIQIGFASVCSSKYCLVIEIPMIDCICEQTDIGVNLWFEPVNFGYVAQFCQSSVFGVGIFLIPKETTKEMKTKSFLVRY